MSKEVDDLTETNHYITLDHCIFLTVNEYNECSADGRIVIHESTIESLGTPDEVEARGKVYDLKGRIVMPGLISTHTHSPSVLFRGLADDKYLHEWLTEYMWPAEKHLTHELTYAGSRLAYLEYLGNGMTTNVDMWYFSDAVSQAAEESGLRSFLSSAVFAFPSPQSEHSLQDTADYLARCYSRPEAVRKASRVYPCVAVSYTHLTLPTIGG